MNDVLGDGGILKEVVQPGDGPPLPHNASVLSIAIQFCSKISWCSCYLPNDFVLPEPLLFLFLPQVHYSGFLEYSEEPFETNTNLKYPQMMKLGRGQ